MNRSTVLSLLILITTLPTLSPCVAQEKDGGGEPVGIFESRNEYYEFMGSFKSAAAGNPDMQSMIPLINDIVLDRPIGWTGQKYGGASSGLGLLSNEGVRESVEMVDDQYEELQKVNSQIQRKLAEQIREFDFSGKSQEEIAEQLQKMQSEANDQLESLLLPHQTTRLRQISMQSQLRRRTLGQLLTSDPVKTDLEITDPQAEKLLDAEKEIEKELEKEIAKLRAEARDKLISELKPEQKEKAEDLIGELFDFSREDEKKSGKKKLGKKGVTRKIGKRKSK